MGQPLGVGVRWGERWAFELERQAVGMGVRARERGGATSAECSRGCAICGVVAAHVVQTWPPGHVPII